MNIRRKSSAGAGAVMTLLVGALILASRVSASDLSISGTLSNFDTYNTTGSDSDGAELELEGIHSTDVSSGPVRNLVSASKQTLGIIPVSG